MQQTPICAEHSIPQTKLIYWQHPEGCRVQQTPTCAEHSIPQTKLIYWQHPEGCRVQQTPTCAEHSIPQTKLIYWQHSGGVECSIPQTKLHSHKIGLRSLQHGSAETVHASHCKVVPLAWPSNGGILRYLSSFSPLGASPPEVNWLCLGVKHSKSFNQHLQVDVNVVIYVTQPAGDK